VSAHVAMRGNACDGVYRAGDSDGSRAFREGKGRFGLRFSRPPRLAATANGRAVCLRVRVRVYAYSCTKVLSYFRTFVPLNSCIICPPTPPSTPPRRPRPPRLAPRASPVVRRPSSLVRRLAYRLTSADASRARSRTRRTSRRRRRRKFPEGRSIQKMSIGQLKGDAIKC
jgi:hypothetical protein